MPDPEYTPTVEQASRAYVTGMRQAFIASAGEHAEEFARFLAARDASIRAAALDEAAEVAADILAEYEAKIVRLIASIDDPVNTMSGREHDIALMHAAKGSRFALGMALSAIRALKEEKK